jgi:hypothetical protein
MLSVGAAILGFVAVSMVGPRVPEAPGSRPVAGQCAATAQQLEQSYSRADGRCAYNIAEPAEPIHLNGQRVVPQTCVVIVAECGSTVDEIKTAIASPRPAPPPVVETATPEAREADSVRDARASPAAQVLLSDPDMAAQRTGPATATPARGPVDPRQFMCRAIIAATGPMCAGTTGANRDGVEGGASKSARGEHVLTGGAISMTVTYESTTGIYTLRRYSDGSWTATVGSYTSPNTTMAAAMADARRNG